MQIIKTSDCVDSSAFFITLAQFHHPRDNNDDEGQYFGISEDILHPGTPLNISGINKGQQACNVMTRKHVSIRIHVEKYSDKLSESDMTYGQVWWPILGIRVLHLTHPRCTHTVVNTHTVNTHPEQWAAIYAVALGEQLGVRCLAQGLTSVVVLRVERAMYIHSPHLQFLAAWDSNLQPFNYESDSLTIRPRLPSGKGGIHYRFLPWFSVWTSQC